MSCIWNTTIVTEKTAEEGNWRMKITVVGAGTWGTALGRIFRLKGHHVCIWSRFQEEAEPGHGKETSESSGRGDSG